AAFYAPQVGGNTLDRALLLFRLRLQSLHLLHGLLHSRFGAAVDINCCALLSKPTRDGEADASSGSADQGCLSYKLQIHRSPSRAATRLVSTIRGFVAKMQKEG